ncbi:MAG: hypothetical protein A2202_06735 [Bdellovibrionales bacterium RIFOXYA1_FULL_36_14]|nr:MAG: hypothetical protein A2202_06735 [Bdellovibrionales bacterium RIFOXYA1_FULL_36_14]
MASGVPELVAPGGSFEKLQVAISYGADAVYIAGENFGLRTAAFNFTNEEIGKATRYAHSRNKKIYVVINAFLHDKDLQGLCEFVKYLEDCKVDAVVVSDFGVISFIKKISKLNIHLSTQNTCLNSYGALLCKEIGIKRIVLGREVSIDEAQMIKAKSGLEMELFIHGSMCMSYSGNCLLSNYSFNRDSNRGGCKHSCRFLYQIDNHKDYFYSSKDLMGLEHLSLIGNSNIDALKIEGRMKTLHYLATVVKAYREGLDQLKAQKSMDQSQLFELSKVMTRDYFSGNLITKADDQSVFEKGKNDKTEDIAGIVLEVNEGKHILLSVKSAFDRNDQLEILPFVGAAKCIDALEMTDVSGKNVERAKTATMVKLPFTPDIKTGNIVRIKRKK